MRALRRTRLPAVHHQLRFVLSVGVSDYVRIASDFLTTDHNILAESTTSTLIPSIVPANGAEAMHITNLSAVICAIAAFLTIQTII
jgi:hypothetical protein